MENRETALPLQTGAVKNPILRRSATRRLNPKTGLTVTYSDDTAFGSTVSGRCEWGLRERYADLYAYRKEHGLARMVKNATEILGRLLPRCLEGLYMTPGRLRVDWLYPDPTLVRPMELCVLRNICDVVARIPLSGTLSADLARYLGDWEIGSKPPGAREARELWDALVEAGALLVPQEQDRVSAERRPGVNFVGHATLGIDDGDSRLLIDPYLVPKSSLYPVEWQPPSLSELGLQDAVLVTHSHPDHFDPGTLLRCGADTPIYVPAVERESVLTIDMVARLRELGFSKVHGVEDWNAFSVGGIRVRAMPFYGEQPTVGERLHPEIRNQGATYLVEAAGSRLAVLADAGSDLSGDVRNLASLAREQHGPIDVLFGGYRGFGLYPVQYVFSSVSRYLPFVPPQNWGERQQIMCDADDLIDAAERWHADRVVPYAAGGAPWFWLRGLGPCLDESMPNAVSTDLPPEYVAEVAARRASTPTDGPITSPVAVDPMRVGNSLYF